MPSSLLVGLSGGKTWCPTISDVTMWTLLITTLETLTGIQSDGTQSELLGYTTSDGSVETQKTTMGKNT